MSDPNDQALLTGTLPSTTVFEGCDFSPGDGAQPAVSLMCPLSAHTQFDTCSFVGSATTMIYASGVRFGLSACTFYNQNAEQMIGVTTVPATDILLDSVPPALPPMPVKIPPNQVYRPPPYILVSDGDSLVDVVSNLGVLLGQTGQGSALASLVAKSPNAGSKGAVAESQDAKAALKTPVEQVNLAGKGTQRVFRGGSGHPPHATPIAVLSSCVATQCQSRSPQFLATVPGAMVGGYGRVGQHGTDCDPA